MYTRLCVPRLMVAVLVVPAGSVSESEPLSESPSPSSSPRSRLLSVLAVVAVFVSGADARIVLKHHPSAAAAAVAPSVTQESSSWLLDASVVNQGEVLASTSELALNGTSSNGWVLYKQCGEDWSSTMIGTSASETICDVGCAMSSVAMALATRGAKVNPGSLNHWLNQNGGVRHTRTHADVRSLAWQRHETNTKCSAFSFSSVRCCSPLLSLSSRTPTSWCGTV